MPSGLHVVPEPCTSSSAICRYGDYLEGVYSRSSVSSDGKFPPTPSKKYVNLAVVERASQIRDIEDVRKNMLHGRVDDMIRGKRKIKLTSILKPQHNGHPASLVFVEGPPGIGKSTLAWELCRRWDRKQYDLAVLLRLREREVQQIESIADLFPHEDKQLQQLVTKEVLGREGKGILFILDGYDELPLSLRHQRLLLKLLKGEVLPKCSVLVTSRPSATNDLFLACSPQIQRHVEILGFTQECVKDYASSVFSSELETLEDFLTYISASENPAINSLMYIPLNAAIIVHVFRNSRRKGCPIPKTFTQVYTQLCLTLLQRFLSSNDPQNRTILNIFSDLPGMYSSNFKQLAQLSFEQFEKYNVVFYSQDVPKMFIHFGFLDSVPALYGGGGVSYNFLHLTLQEFLAAYHITQLPNGIDVFKCHSEDERWEVVWRFVSGLTEFQYFMDSVRCAAFVSVSKDDEYLTIKNLLLNCLFEGQLMFDCMAVLGRSKISSYQHHSSSPLDRYALGFCIANCSSATSWKVHIENGSDESFMWGLNSNHCGNGIISHLAMENVFSVCLTSYPSATLYGINHFEVHHDYEYDTNVLVQVLPLMMNLTSLHLDTEPVPLLLDAISQRTNVATLILEATVVYKTLLLSLHDLVNSKILKDLAINISRFSVNASTKPLCDVLFGPSSLNQLSLGLPHFAENSFDLLETNICLTNVHISSEDALPLQPLSKILQNNKTVEKVRWECYYKLEDLDSFAKQVEALNMALSFNTTLKELTLVAHTSHYLSPHIPDVRVKLDHRAPPNFDSFALNSDD